VLQGEGRYRAHCATGGLENANAQGFDFMDEAWIQHKGSNIVIRGPSYVTKAPRKRDEAEPRGTKCDGISLTWISPELNKVHGLKASGIS